MPYTGSLGARVTSLEAGRATVTLRDRRAVRNHLRSVHAAALANLLEMASGLAMVGALGRDVRGIPVQLTIRYLAKARGRLTATGTAAPPSVTAPVEALAHATIVDAEGIVVADGTVTWRLDRR